MIGTLWNWWGEGRGLADSGWGGIPEAVDRTSKQSSKVLVTKFQ